MLAAANGGEALLMCSQHVGPIHLVLTDVVMLRMSGRLLTSELVKLRPTLKVLYTPHRPSPHLPTAFAAARSAIAQDGLGRRICTNGVKLRQGGFP